MNKKFQSKIILKKKAMLFQYKPYFTYFYWYKKDSRNKTRVLSFFDLVDYRLGKATAGGITVPGISIDAPFELLSNVHF